METNVKIFNKKEKVAIRETFARAESVTGKYFQLAQEDWKEHRYEVKTLEHLEDYEKNEEAFAQLCKYVYQKREDQSPSRDFHFYRICLQDRRILDAVDRGGSFIRFTPLMLYIATHELVHIVRFNREDSDFDTGLEEKKKEEEKVHTITRDILKPRADSQLGLVLDCFGNDYRIGDMV